MPGVLPGAGHLLKATLWAATGSALFAFMWVLPKLVGAGVPSVQVACLRYAAGAVVIAPFFVTGIVRGEAVTPETVSYTHLTLPTTPYV